MSRDLLGDASAGQHKVSCRSVDLAPGSVTFPWHSAILTNSLRRINEHVPKIAQSVDILAHSFNPNRGGVQETGG